MPSTIRDISLLDEIQGTANKVLDFEAIKEFLGSKEGREVASNGITDMVIVRLPEGSFAANDALIQQATNAMYVVTGNTDRPVSDEYGALFGSSRRLQAKTPIHYVYITPEVVTGIFTGFFFLFTVLLGLSCMGGIQTPARYSLQAPPHGKEY